MNFDTNLDFEGNDKNFEYNDLGRDFMITWSRKDYGTSRLMLPGANGPLWSSCARRITKDIDADQIIEDRPIGEITGRERRREFRGGPRNVVTASEYQVTHDTQPHQWECP